jgi:hypothetical protein
MLSWVRHPRTVHCAEYPQASKLNLGGHGEPVNALFFLEMRIVDCNAVEERIGVNAFGAHSAYHVSEFVAHEFAVIEAFLLGGKGLSNIPVRKGRRVLRRDEPVA